MIGLELTVSNSDYKVIGWKMFYELTKKIAQRIKASGYSPNIIVGLSPEEWILARVLCDLLETKKLLSLKAEHWNDTSISDDDSMHKYLLSLNLSGKQLLLVGDLDNSEETQQAIQFIKRFKPDNLRTAALVHLEDSDLKPDFYGEEIKERSIILPWSLDCYASIDNCSC